MRALLSRVCRPSTGPARLRDALTLLLAVLCAGVGLLEPRLAEDLWEERDTLSEETSLQGESLARAPEAPAERLAPPGVASGWLRRLRVLSASPSLLRSPLLAALSVPRATVRGHGEVPDPCCVLLARLQERGPPQA